MIKLKTFLIILESEVNKCKTCKGKGEIEEHSVKDYGELGQDVDTKVLSCHECRLLRKVIERVQKREESNLKRKERRSS